VIIPAILEKNWEEIENKIEISKTLGRNVHIDFIDGKFTDNTSFLDPSPFKKYSNDLNLEAHLMVEEPVNYLESLALNGFNKFIGHIEKMKDQVEFIAKGEVLGAVGLGIDLDTDLNEIKVNLEDLDQVLVMAVKAGKSGQTFNSSVIEKIKILRGKYLGNIEVDGGINDKTLIEARNAGANQFCVTSFLFNEDPIKQFNLLRNLI
jgi:ribulose-phosphate 3-epimerase